MANASSLPHEKEISPTESNDGIRERLLHLVLDDNTDAAPNASYIGAASQTDDNNCGLPVKNLHNAPVAFRNQPSREQIKNMICAAEEYVAREILSGGGNVHAFLWHLRYDKGPVGVYLRHFARKHKGSTATFETLLKSAEVCFKNSSLQLASSDDKLHPQNSEHGKETEPNTGNGFPRTTCES